jgi:hypothetical protein
MFTKIGPNTVSSDEGWQVEVLGRTGIRYTENGRAMKIDSEVLAGPAGMAIYSASIRSWLPPHQGEPVDEITRTRIIENVRRAFEFEGFSIDIF